MLEIKEGEKIRAIEFRGKQTNTNQWVYGYLYRNKGLYVICENIRYAKEEPILLRTVGQYTGLKDKNGKKIFEGDIVRTYNKDICIVKYNYNQFGLSVVDKSKTYAWVDFILYNLEVIGNIYDNPDLLKEE